MSTMNRRDLLKAGLASGVAVFVAPWGSPAYAALFEERILSPLPWHGASGKVAHRIDGIAKVSGAKVFAADIRARDMPHWPQAQSHAMLLRVTEADRPYMDFDLGSLDRELAPDRIVTAAELERDGVAFPPFYGEDMLLPEGKTPAYLGQAVALLIWHDFARYRLAKNAMRGRREIIRYGAPSGPLERDPWGSFRYVRVGGATPFDDDAYSTLEDGVILGAARQHEVQWPRADRNGRSDEIGMYHAEAMRQALDRPPREWKVYAREYFSQSTDTCAFEADNANGWYDAETATMHLVTATQSPQEVATEGAALLAASAFAAKRLMLHPCYTVGYGSKDHHNMPFYGLMAALYGEGRPVRLANDRYEHFQSALKRHSFALRYRMAVDRESGAFRIFQGEFEGNGGGRSNFSSSVALVAATAAQSVYYFPQNDLAAVALASRAVDAGSARGYGTLQSMSATEMMVDEIAEDLGIDAIEFRLRNVLRSGMKNTQGAIPAGAVRIDEILDRARAHPLWGERAARKRAYETAHPDEAYGVGFGVVQKDFGTGAEAAFVRVELDAEGHIALHLPIIDIGTGSATAQAALCAQSLGRPADEVRTGVVDFPELPMHTSGNPWIISQADQDAAQADPMWTPNLFSPTSASNSAFYIAHATREAARRIFEHGLWPAAQAIWREGAGGGQFEPLLVRREDARWVDGRLTAAGLSPLPLSRLAAKAHALGGVTGAVVHTFNRWAWTYADFEIGGRSEKLALDGLALRHGDGSGEASSGGYRVHERSAVYYPPAARNGAGTVYYAGVGTLAEVAVDRRRGSVRLLSHHSIVECGNQLVPELVSGQIQGGIAMGIGHALTEYLPLYEDGPGNGEWNLHRYHLPRASDVAVWTQTAEVLPALSDTDPPKGMAEVTAIPVIAAIVNGIAHATGKRFRALPVTADKIREALA
jgi:CO/xanthine dehydrogenase Mo-binding subunit